MSQPAPSGLNAAGCKHWVVSWVEDGQAHVETKKGYANAFRFVRNLPGSATEVSIEEVPGGCC